MSMTRRRIGLVVFLVGIALARSGGEAHAVFPAASVTRFTVRSTLDHRTVLPLRIHWIAKTNIPTSHIEEVDFLIDGRVAWTEHNPPYVYASDGNWLVTSFLKPGKHIFSVRAISTTGQTARDTIKARVQPAPAPPANLAGNWSRTVTDSDLQKCTTQAQGGCPPTGTWQITISSKGWSPTDPQGNVGLFDVAYLTQTSLQMRPTIEYPPYPNNNNGGWCSDTDPLTTYTVSTNPTAQTMTLNAAGNDPCGDRAAILQGTWTHP